MSLNRAVRRGTTAAAALSATAALCLFVPSSAAAGPSAVELPPPGAGFDYQIGGAYTPPQGVRIVSRDLGATPARGLYNLCYINAFQAQPGAEREWDADLLLRDASGDVVHDDDWDEAVLDIRTAAKRERIAAKVNRWIDSCADKGFQAVEPDNYDTYTRFPDHLKASQAKAFVSLLSAHAHDKGLAIAQKNTPDLAVDREETGLDFAVAEECGEWDECDMYADAFGDRVLVVEYSAKGLEKACAGWGDRLSVVRRDVGVAPEGASGHLRRTC
ncbi:endo alpha-1,4 polygalactosaminidase [Streptomyces alfalfae]|uniref:endo alpha-1,4 polygalactosaminidase n=1 Tax=Streptomyces alfalfae TaxID=1642299 RepID=UPI001BAB6A6B|nr:endo alpha-1,4 polygalactosaminidase [Streptomyces alfalfae]QUI30065.1 endo alpha-1,4 polygalactosaminidase [Streptomyces alfalfae]